MLLMRESGSGLHRSIHWRDTRTQSVPESARNHAHTIRAPGALGLSCTGGGIAANPVTFYC